MQACAPRLGLAPDLMNIKLFVAFVAYEMSAFHRYRPSAIPRRPKDVHELFQAEIETRPRRRCCNLQLPRVTYGENY